MLGEPWASPRTGEHATEALGLTRTGGACHRSHGPHKDWGSMSQKPWASLQYKEMGWLPIQTVARENWSWEHTGRVQHRNHTDNQMRYPEEGGQPAGQDRGQEGPHAARIDLEQEHKQGEGTERDSRNKDTQCPHG